ncbi:MAG: hypothetical protein HKN63_11710 [Rhodobacteraceae bacterium]|nr:hypothetical protein [Paracoccaceae bacterium]
MPRLTVLLYTCTLCLGASAAASATITAPGPGLTLDKSALSCAPETAAPCQKAAAVIAGAPAGPLVGGGSRSLDRPALPASQYISSEAEPRIVFRVPPHAYVRTSDRAQNSPVFGSGIAVVPLVPALYAILLSLALLVPLSHYRRRRARVQN